MATIQQECTACDGTGLYVGMGERDGAAVVCSRCSGTGCHEYSYEPFRGMKVQPGVTRVFERNPGICIGMGGGKFELSDFGGMPAKDWVPGAKFPAGSENRMCTCPRWWYQGVDVTTGHWPECRACWGGSFSDCDHFPTKAKCWERWDAAQGDG